MHGRKSRGVCPKMTRVYVSTDCGFVSVSSYTCIFSADYFNAEGIKYFEKTISALRSSLPDFGNEYSFSICDKGCRHYVSYAWVDDLLAWTCRPNMYNWLSILHHQRYECCICPDYYPIRFGASGINENKHAMRWDDLRPWDSTHQGVYRYAAKQAKISLLALDASSIISFVILVPMMILNNCMVLL